MGYARVSTIEMDLTAHRDALERLGVHPSNIHTDRGMTGTNRERPGLLQALAACRDGDTFVVSKLDRLALSFRMAKDIADELTAKRHDPEGQRLPAHLDRTDPGEVDPGPIASVHQHREHVVARRAAHDRAGPADVDHGPRELGDGAASVASADRRGDIEGEEVGERAGEGVAVEVTGHHVPP